MGSGTLFDPINSLEAFGFGEFDTEASQMNTEMPSITSETGAIVPQAEQATFSESEEATVRKNVTKKRLGTGQAKIPLKTEGVGVVT